MSSTMGIMSLTGISMAATFVLVAIKLHISSAWRFQWLSLVGQLGFLDNGNVDIVAVVKSQQYCDFSVDSARVPLCQSKTVGVGVETGPWLISISLAH